MRTRCFALAALLLAAALPAAAAERYTIDPEHTFPSLEFSHLGISVWRGKFERTRGSVTLDREARTGSVDIAVETASLDWGLASMNEASRKEAWLDAARFPTATYRGTVVFAGDAPSAVRGQLTLKGITRDVPLTIRSFKCIPHPLTRRELCGADVEGELHWSHFGMKRYGDEDSDRVRLRIQVEALKRD